MPEDTAPQRDGKPDDQRKLRPTVMAPSAREPRSPVTPPGRDDRGPAPIKATVMDGEAAGLGKSGTASRPHRSKAQAPAVARPTSIPGVERKRIEVGMADLRQLAPLARPAVLERTLRLVETFVAGRAGTRQAVMWGHEVQQDYSDLILRTLELSQSELLTRVGRHVHRMVDILAAVDIEAVSGGSPHAGLFGRYLRTISRKIDTLEELDDARRELDHLVGLMGAALEQLLALKDVLAGHAGDVERMGDEAEAWAIAAEFLSAHLRRAQPAVSQRFLERSMSLIQTVAQIRGSASIREVQTEQPLRLIAAIQNVALVMVPGWLASIAAVTAMQEGRRQLTAAEAGELNRQINNILQQLKE